MTVTATPYIPNKRQPMRSPEELRAQIPGWGADLDPADRPSYPREQPGIETGARWDFPERQPGKWPRERSVEHAFLPPVFGTSTPPAGLSGAIRRYAYKYGEGRAAHWLLLMGADRVDAWEHHLKSLATSHPDNPVTETGVVSEFRRGGLSSRSGQNRTDVNHQWMDPIIVAGPWVMAAVGLAAAYKTLRKERTQPDTRSTAQAESPR
jgi:hypothetical protein